MTAASKGAGRGQQGVATVWAVAWIFVCLTVGWLGLVLALAVAGQHHLDGAADLASLSGAAELQRGGNPCPVARSVADANFAEMVSCRVHGDDVTIEVQARISLPFRLRPRLVARARAGPR